MMSRKFELIARAVVIREGRLLLCRNTGDDFFFLPGGHVEAGESAEAALVRELREELGVELQAPMYIGSVPHAYQGGSGICRELNLLYQASFQEAVIESREVGLKFLWADAEMLPDLVLLPEQISILVGTMLTASSEPRSPQPK